MKGIPYPMGWLLIITLCVFAIMGLLIYDNFAPRVPFKVGDEVRYVYSGTKQWTAWVLVERTDGNRFYIDPPLGDNKWVSFDHIKNYQIKREWEKEQQKMKGR